MNTFQQQGCLAKTEVGCVHEAELEEWEAAIILQEDLTNLL